MNPYLAKLRSLNFEKATPRAPDKTDKTRGEVGCVSFVGAQGCRVSEIDAPAGVAPDVHPHSGNIPSPSNDQAPARTSLPHVHPWSDAEEERIAIAEYDGGAPRVWAEALARLDSAHPPGDIPPKRWLRFIDDCGRFLDGGWTISAAALGWGPLDLFGCDRNKPFARIDRAGLLWLLDGRELLALTADTAVIATESGCGLTFRRCTDDGRWLGNCHDGFDTAWLSGGACSDPVCISKRHAHSWAGSS